MKLDELKTLVRRQSEMLTHEMEVQHDPERIREAIAWGICRLAESLSKLEHKAGSPLFDAELHSAS